MQFIILAAGKSTRTHPLTITKPKPLLKIANKTILEHNLEQIKEFAKEIIIVVGYKKEQVIGLVKEKYPKLRIKFVEQKEQLGTGHALMQVESHIKDKFVMLGGDDLFFKEDINKLLKNKYGILVKEVNNPKSFGVIKTKGKFMHSIIEKPEKKISNLVNSGCYLLDKNIFSYLKQIKKSKRNEYELIDAINKLAKKQNIVYIKSDWIPITYPWDLINANEFLLKNIKTEIKGKIEKYATVKGNLKLGKNSILKSGVYIEGNVIIGENCVIGPNCYIRGYSSIGNDCKIGQAVEIKNSVVGENSKVPHLSYIGDSVIGDNANIGAGTITANLRHDHGIVKSMIKGELIETGRHKFGTIIADNAHTGIKTTIYPGRKIYPNKETLPGEIIKEDVV